MARDVAAARKIAVKAVHKLARDPIRTTVAHRERRVKKNVAFLPETTTPSNPTRTASATAAAVAVDADATAAMKQVIPARSRLSKTPTRPCRLPERERQQPSP